MCFSVLVKHHIIISISNQSHLFMLCIFSQLVDELSYSHKHWQHQTRCQYNEDAAQILDAHGTRFIPLVLQTAAAAPPLLFEHVKTAIFQDTEDGNCDFIPVWRAWNKFINRWESSLEPWIQRRLRTSFVLLLKV